MLIHIVCWKYAAHVLPEQRAEHIGRLRLLPAVIGCIRAFEVGADVVHLERSFDTGLVAAFDDRAGLDEYTVHPEHQAVAELGRNIAERVVSVDFFSDAPQGERLAGR